MSTNASNPTAYASVDDALTMGGDLRLWGELCGDAGVRYTAPQLKDLTGLPGQRIAALLLKASFKVEAACVRGGRYSALDLAGLTGVSQVGLKGLVVDLAIVMAQRVRYPGAPTSDLAKEVEKDLERLEDGSEVFAIQEVEDAGAGVTDVLAPGTSKGPRPPLSLVAGRFFGRRSRSYGPNGWLTRGCW